MQLGWRKQSCARKRGDDLNVNLLAELSLLVKLVADLHQGEAVEL